ncbi:MAG: hypothetical protein GXP24_02160 [Planctomycetes bacterium]|nr:hypothetical protein [Planctomycetota bacterium]
MGLSNQNTSTTRKRVCFLAYQGALACASCLYFLLSPFASAETVSALDDIQFWVGSGANRAAMVIDWDDTSATDESLVWGYRWDGTATGEDMLLAVLESDTRLFAKLSSPNSGGVALYGLGYDRNDDGQFAISDSTPFNADGIAITGTDDGATSVDSSDLYAEGFFNAFWHYGLSSGNPFDEAPEGDEWASSGGGASGRTLSDGDWDSWTFTPTFDFTSFAENPIAAESPFSADFDSDDDTDGTDFLAWQRGFGIDVGATLAQGDADGNGTVDAFDLQLWSTNFGSVAMGGALLSASFVVPEPSCIACALWVFFVFVSFGTRQSSRRKIS